MANSESKIAMVSEKKTGSSSANESPDTDQTKQAVRNSKTTQVTVKHHSSAVSSSTRRRRRDRKLPQSARFRNCHAIVARSPHVCRRSVVVAFQLFQHDWRVFAARQQLHVRSPAREYHKQKKRWRPLTRSNRLLQDREFARLQTWLHNRSRVRTGKRKVDRP